LSGLSDIDDLFERIKVEITNSKDFSVNLTQYVDQFQGSEPLIMLHTSGTTEGKLSGVKWFHITKDLIQRLWAPGMQAIFESSGLNSKESAVIFVPSRTKYDGKNIINEKKVISLYSSEFSQRIMLSVIKPESYLLFEYKYSKDLNIISKILSLNKISVISAPAATILGWADINEFQNGIEKSLVQLKNVQDESLQKLVDMIKREGINRATLKIQKLLSDKLSKATVIFSTSSLNTSQWKIIRKFMKWKVGKERFTNLYVASEIGPFASSLGDFKISRANKMYVFPLSIPTIECKNSRDLLINSKEKFGKLLVSRLNDSSPLINIDTDDVISIEDQKGLPQIGGNIYRAQFRLKYEINVSEKIDLPKNYDTYVGDYFILDEIHFFVSKNLLDCLNLNCNSNLDSILLVKNKNINNSNSEFNLISQNLHNCKTPTEVYNSILKCPELKGIKNLIEKNLVKIYLIDEPPINFKKARIEILTNVRNGNVPKGILKKWALYLVVPTN